MRSEQRKPPVVFEDVARAQRESIDKALFGEQTWNRFLQNAAAGAQTSISFGALTFRPGNDWEIFEVSLVVVSEYLAGGAFQSVPCRLSITSGGNAAINQQLDNAVDALVPAFDGNTHFLAFGGDGQPVVTNIRIPAGVTVTLQGRAWDNYVLNDTASFYINIRYRIAK